MWVGNFIVAAGATMVMPFLSLYIDSLGSYSDAFVQRWSGYVFGITFLTAFFFAPIWGRIGDRFGRKPILIMNGLGIGLCILLMSFVDNVYQLFILRAFMGVVTGFISTSVALIATQTPKEKAGEILGLLQTGNVSGSLLGPVIGGLLADLFGIGQTFYITSILLFISTLLVLFGVKEERIQDKDERKKEKQTPKEVFQSVFLNPVLVTVLVVTFMIQLANFSIQPLLALYVEQIAPQAVNIAFLAGLAFSATGLGNLISAKIGGTIGDRKGYGKVLVFVLFFAALVFIPQAFVTNIWQLILLRFLLGLQIGSMLPSIHAIIRQVSPVHIQGEVFGYKTSFQFLGNFVGPLLGGAIAGAWNIEAVFFSTSFLLFCAAFLAFFVLRNRT